MSHIQGHEGDLGVAMALDIRTQVKPHHPLVLLYHNAPEQADKLTGHAVTSCFWGGVAEQDRIGCKLLLAGYDLISSD